MRKAPIEHRSQFFKGFLFGVVLVIFKFIIFMPVDIADILYGSALIVTLVITVGELFGSSIFVLESRILDFVIGLLFPLDFYAVLILFGVPLTN